MLLNTQGLASLFTSYNAAFQRGFTTVAPEWENIATLIPSNNESNLYAFLGQFPQFRKWIGDRVVKSMMTHNYTIVNETYESTVGVPREKIEDDTFGVFTPMMEEMGAAAATHPDEIMFMDILLNGNTEVGYDGQFFFDTDHPVIENGATVSKSNIDTTGGGDFWYLMDTRRPLKPLIWQVRRDYNFDTFTDLKDPEVFKRKEFLFGVDARVAGGYGLWQLAYASQNTLNATNFDTYVDAMMALKSDEGRPLGIRPNLLVCGPSNRAAARTLIQTQFLASGASNPNFQEVEVLVTSWLP